MGLGGALSTLLSVVDFSYGSAEPVATGRGSVRRVNLRVDGAPISSGYPIHGDGYANFSVAPTAQFGPHDSVMFTLSVGSTRFLRYGCEDKVKFVRTGCEFLEDTNQDHGFDDYSDENPWKSVKIGETDPVKASIWPSTEATNIHFSDGGGVFSRTPGQASSSPQTVQLQGIQETFEPLWATYGDGGELLATLDVWSFNARSPQAVELVYMPTEGDSFNQPPDAAAVETWLNSRKGFDQAVATFSVNGPRTVSPKPAADSDGIDNAFSKEELQSILGSVGGTGLRVVVVRKMSEAAGTAWFQPVLFVALEQSDINTTIAHELGHYPFILGHTSNDQANMMYQGGGGWRLRYWQWFLVNSAPTP